MTNKQLIRTLMIETPSIPGSLGKVATIIGLAGGDIGEIETIKVGPNYTIRNITVQVDHEGQIEELESSFSDWEEVFGFMPSQMKSFMHMKEEKNSNEKAK
ncbi:hypothetical protein GCM10020331_056700 [Ectobacillus funiculus]